MTETPKVEIAGQEKPLEVALEWKTASAIDSIDKAVNALQTTMKDAWTQTAAGIDVDALATAVGAAVSAALRDALPDLMAMAQPFETPAPTIATTAIANAIRESLPKEATAPLTLDPKGMASALVTATQATSNAQKWNHSVVTTDAPPTEDLLDKAGMKGYELINVVFDPAAQKWVSFLKKLVVG